MSNAKFYLVAVPKPWVKDWMIELLILAFGHERSNKGPFRLLFRDLTATEQMNYAGKE